MKICATTLGETAGDLLSITLKVGYAVSSVILLGFFIITLLTQLRAKKFHAYLYWMVILSTSTAGTTMSDYMDRSLGLGYAKGSAILASILGAVFLLWFLLEKNLSVVHIKTQRSEIFYWVAILFSNTLGTALGDFLADDSGLGFFGGAVLIGSLLLLLLALFQFTLISRVGLFWLAFVLTRPFGATMGDVLTKLPEQGGLGLGTIGSSVVLAVILFTTIWVTQKKLFDKLFKGVSRIFQAYPTFL